MHDISIRGEIMTSHKNGYNITMKKPERPFSDPELNALLDKLSN